MEMIKKTVGILLLILSAAKVIGVIVLLISGEPERTVWWFAKQIAYAITFGSIAIGLLRSSSNSQG